MRIIAGEYRGRSLKTLRGREVRPTSDKLRETLFNVLRAEVPGSVFIDCYAGSGAVGLEALSRGASRVYLIEKAAAAAHVIGQNVAALGLEQTARIVRSEAKSGLRKLEAQGVRAGICFLDPPYASLAEALRHMLWLSGSALMHQGGIMILEHSRIAITPENIGQWKRTRLLQQGSSALSFYRTE